MHFIEGSQNFLIKILNSCTALQTPSALYSSQYPMRIKAPHLTEEEMEAQRVYTSCPRSHNELAAVQQESRILDFQSHALTAMYRFRLNYVHT